MKLVAVFIAGALTVCGVAALSHQQEVSSSNSLKQAAMNLSSMSEECLLDVRDRNIKYEASTSCNKLEALSLAYIELGGSQSNEPADAQLIAEQAKSMAWMAKAISSGSTTSLW